MEASENTSFIIYSGPSELDGAPIIVVATFASKNSKTGDMVQVWIMRADIAPHLAKHSGADSSICGDCKHRGSIVDGRNVGRSCYVLLHNAPRSVYAAYHRGNYLDLTNKPKQVAKRLAGHFVRLGAYGDPAAVPTKVWRNVTSASAGFTGYTHQWKAQRFAYLARYCMASADTAAEQLLAVAQGWRTFRVKTSGADLLPLESACPASAEAGRKLTCSQCRACSGSSRGLKGSIAIDAHGNGSGNFERLTAA